MNQVVISDGYTRFTRISKREARKLFDAGKAFYIIAHKMRPGMPFSMGMTIDGAHVRAERQCSPTYPTPEHFFDATVTEFCWYNANCHETGTYAAYYTMADVRQSQSVRAS